MQSQTKSSGMKLPEVHGVSKNLDHTIQPEKQTIRLLRGNYILQEKQRIGQGRAGIRRRRLPLIRLLLKHQKIPEASKVEKKIINHSDFTTPVQSVNNPSMEAINRRPMLNSKTFLSTLIQFTDLHLSQYKFLWQKVQKI